MDDAVLELKDLYVGYYKDLNILQALEIKARREQITAVLGANGVGKSTALKAAFGFLRPNQGDVVLEGESIIDVPTHSGSVLQYSVEIHLCICTVESSDNMIPLVGVERSC